MGTALEPWVRADLTTIPPLDPWIHETIHFLYFLTGCCSHLSLRRCSQFCDGKMRLSVVCGCSNGSDKSA